MITRSMDLSGTPIRLRESVGSKMALLQAESACIAYISSTIILACNLRASYGLVTRDFVLLGRTYCHCAVPP